MAFWHSYLIVSIFDVYQCLCHFVLITHPDNIHSEICFRELTWYSLRRKEQSSIFILDGFASQKARCDPVWLLGLQMYLLKELLLQDNERALHPKQRADLRSPQEDYFLFQGYCFITLHIYFYSSAPYFPSSATGFLVLSPWLDPVCPRDWGTWDFLQFAGLGSGFAIRFTVDSGDTPSLTLSKIALLLLTQFWDH